MQMPLKTKASKKSTGNRVRFQLELAPSVIERLDNLTEETGNPSRAETLRRALGFYWFLVKETKKGNKIQILSANGTTDTIVVLETTE